MPSDIEELYLQEEALQRREFQRRETRQAEEDLASLARTPEGLATLRRLFRNMGLLNPLANDAGQIALRNEALRWLRLFARANPTAATRMLMDELLAD